MVRGHHAGAGAGFRRRVLTDHPAVRKAALGALVGVDPLTIARCQDPIELAFLDAVIDAGVDIYSQLLADQARLIAEAVWG